MSNSTILRRVRRWQSILLAFILGALVGPCWFAIVAPRSTPELPYLRAQGLFEKRSSQYLEQQKLYACQHVFPSWGGTGVTTYTFRRLDGLPLLWLIDTEWVHE